MVVNQQQPADTPAYPLLATCMRDGTFLHTARPAYSSAHGVWRRSGGRWFAVAFEQFVSMDGDGEAMAALLETQATVEPAEMRNAFSAPLRYDLHLPDGASSFGSEVARGTRIRFELSR